MSFIPQNNIFISDEGHALIADFGLSRSAGDDLLSLDQSGHGGLFWRAPELLDEAIAQDTICSTASDIYAYACTVIEVCSRVGSCVHNHPKNKHTRS
jgi:serine/threonine protein kinase